MSVSPIQVRGVVLKVNTLLCFRLRLCLLNEFVSLFTVLVGGLMLTATRGCSSPEASVPGSVCPAAREERRLLSDLAAMKSVC